MTERNGRTTAYFTHTQTAVGPLLIAGDRDRLMAIKFDVPQEQLARAVKDLHREFRGRVDLVRDDERLRALTAQVVAYVDGDRTTFDVEIDLSYLTQFQRDVLLETARVPRGQVASYADIARRVGRPGACRAVGNTMRINPIPIVIPCHRIIASDGGLGGFGGGLDVKRQLLRLEGALLLD